jgi:hypothetical protein
MGYALRAIGALGLSFAKGVASEKEEETEG